SRRRHTRFSRDWSSDVCSSDLWNILLWDVLPYLMSYICMAFVLQISSAILAEAGLSLLGLGPSDSVSLGIMLNWALVGESLRTEIGRASCREGVEITGGAGTLT